MAREPDEPAGTPEKPGRAQHGRRELDEIFGDVLPSTTSDEREPDHADSDSWYERNRPPHHDGD
ncbi:hypothetical protein [Actinophytocola sp.]|uniref:hypothetical protein n=1 Tax=Actinophytocola sp. TaxID=1872138 RepID=UPI003D6B3BE8